MRYLISQVWREQDTEKNVHLFENASEHMRQKTTWKKYQNTDRWRRLTYIRKGKSTVPVKHKNHKKSNRKKPKVRKHKNE